MPTSQSLRGNGCYQQSVFYDTTKGQNAWRGEYSSSSRFVNLIYSQGKVLNSSIGLADLRIMIVGLTFGVTGVTIYSMKQSKRKPTTSIRVNLDILHKARIAAVIQKKTLGQWLEEAIIEKVDREQKQGKEI